MISLHSEYMDPLSPMIVTKRQMPKKTKLFHLFTKMRSTRDPIGDMLSTYDPPLGNLTLTALLLFLLKPFAPSFSLRSGSGPGSGNPPPPPINGAGELGLLGGLLTLGVCDPSPPALV